MKENPKDGKNRNNGNHDSCERVLPPRGDYRTLLSFQKAEVIYDITSQLKTLEKEFVEQGGLRERMTRVRLANRNNQGRK